jgi:hypothetical protein
VIRSFLRKERYQKLINLAEGITVWKTPPFR